MAAAAAEGSHATWTAVCKDIATKGNAGKPDELISKVEGAGTRVTEGLDLDDPDSVKAAGSRGHGGAQGPGPVGVRGYDRPRGRRTHLNEPRLYRRPGYPASTSLLPACSLAPTPMPSAPPSTPQFPLSGPREHTVACVPPKIQRELRQLPKSMATSAPSQPDPAGMLSTKGGTAPCARRGTPASPGMPRRSAESWRSGFAALPRA